MTRRRSRAPNLPPGSEPGEFFRAIYPETRGNDILTVAVGWSRHLAYFSCRSRPCRRWTFQQSVQGRLPGAERDDGFIGRNTAERHYRHRGITEMTSSSSLGSTSVVLQFDLNRNIDAAARDVQAAINAARSQLPPNLPSNPSYKKVNPADAPVLMLALTSDFVERARIYDLASSVLQQKLSQVNDVSEADVVGGALPAVRVDSNPTL
jgi:multidrug efflux pump